MHSGYFWSVCVFCIICLNCNKVSRLPGWVFGICVFCVPTRCWFRSILFGFLQQLVTETLDVCSLKCSGCLRRSVMSRCKEQEMRALLTLAFLSALCLCWHPTVILSESNPTHLSACLVLRQLRKKTVMSYKVHLQAARATLTLVLKFDKCFNTSHFLSLSLSFLFSPAAIAQSQRGHGRDGALHFEDLSERQWSQTRGEILVTGYTQGFNPESKTKERFFPVTL